MESKEISTPSRETPRTTTGAPAALIGTRPWRWPRHVGTSRSPRSTSTMTPTATPRSASLDEAWTKNWKQQMRERVRIGHAPSFYPRISSTILAYALRRILARPSTLMWRAWAVCKQLWPWMSTASTAASSSGGRPTSRTACSARVGAMDDNNARISR